MQQKSDWNNISQSTNKNTKKKKFTSKKKKKCDIIGTK